MMQSDTARKATLQYKFCLKSFSTLQNYVEKMAKKLQCQMCVTFYCLTIVMMISHLFKVHRHDPDFSVTCEVPGCHSIFKNINTYKSHLRRSHNNINLHLEFEDNTEDGENSGSDEEQHVHEDEGEDLCGNDEANMYDKLEDRIEANKRLNAFYLLETKEAHLLTQKTLDGIVGGSTKLVKNTIQLLQGGVQNQLDRAGIDFDAVPGLRALFQDNHPISNPFEHVDTKNKQKTYYKEKFGLLEPRRITLGFHSMQRRSGKRYKEVLKGDEAMYIPILKSLEQMLNKDSILEGVLNCHQRNDDQIEDFCDAEVFRRHPLYSRDPTALQIMLYYDEVEVTNPLGSKTGKHKLGVIYYTLGNIHPKHRSQLDAIQLLAIATTPVIKKYGIDALLEPFMEDLQKLEQDAGHQFSIHGRWMSLAGTIVYVSGDNLGSQLIGGFKEGSNANLKCRHCMGTSDAVKTLFCEKDFTLRTRVGHTRQCQQIEQNQDLGKVYGINRRSILCNSRYYSVIDGLPGDAMHDLLEGLLQYECKELLKKLILEENHFTLEQLNHRLKRFDFGYYNDKNRPTPISHQTLTSQNNSLKQKAAQMWCLARFLPLIIGNLVPEDDEHWQLFLTLLQITDIVLSPVTSVDSIGYLEGLISEHHHTFVQIYPESSVIPKMHYLVHYPAHMFKFGPMVRSWCMRYEAKHRYFKQLAGYIGNFTNVPYTMAERHQHRQCYLLNSSENETYLKKPTMIGNGKLKMVAETDYHDKLQDVTGLDGTDNIYEANNVNIHGTNYKVGAMVWTGFSNNMPEFASICKIALTPSDNRVYFHIKKYVTLQYVPHFHAFEVRKEIRPETALLEQDQLTTYLPAHTVKPYGTKLRNGSMYVAPRFMVPES